MLNAYFIGGKVYGLGSEWVCVSPAALFPCWEVVSGFSFPVGLPRCPGAVSGGGVERVGFAPLLQTMSWVAIGPDTRLGPA